jgi:non-ribosomal peptide synthetase component F
LSQALRSLSRREGTTLFMTLLAAFKVLLYRYAKQDDIVVGTNVAGRNWLETEGLIGFFLNQLVLRTDFSGNPTFRELLGRVRDVLLGAYAHQDMPFDRLVEALVPERDVSRTPLFQIKVDLQNNFLSLAQLGDLKVAPLSLAHPASHFDLLLLLAESDQYLHVALHYKTDLFDEDTIARMLENFAQLLRHIVVQPDARLKELTELIVDADMQHRLSQQRQHKELNLRTLKKIKRHDVVNSPVATAE